MAERRTTKTEIRAANDGRTFEGYAARYNEPTQIGNPRKGGFFEQVGPTAFQRSLGEGSDVAALFNHDPNLLLGRTASGTLRLEHRDDGLHVTNDLPDTTTGNDVRALVNRGDIRGMSFTFVSRKDEWKSMPGGHAQLRTLHDVDILDVSPVTFPAYPSTTASVRSIAADGAETRYMVAGYGVQDLVGALDAAIDGAVTALAHDNPAQAAAHLAGAAVLAQEITYTLYDLPTDLLLSLGLPDVGSLVTSAAAAVSAACIAVKGGDATVAVQAAAQAVDLLLAALNVNDPDDSKGDDAPGDGDATAQAGDADDSDFRARARDAELMFALHHHRANFIRMEAY